jgi:hypothetical protein
MAQSNEAGGREDERVVSALVELPETRIKIPADR